MATYKRTCCTEASFGDDKAFHNNNGFIGSNGLLTRVKRHHDLVSHELVGDANIIST